MTCFAARLPAPTDLRRHLRGFSLTELMVALAINAFVMAGALTLYQRHSQHYQFLQAAAALEERLTFAMRALIDSTQAAGFFHLTTGSPPPVPATAFCGGRDVTAWALATIPILEVNSAGSLPCSTVGRAMTGSDILVSRHLDSQPAVPEQQAHAWYVDTRSSESGLPSLRRQTLLADGRVQNQEIMPGITALRVRSVVDSDGDGLGDSLHNGPIAGALAVLLEVVVQSDRNDIGDRTARRLITVRNQP
ncbi:MAG: prepilin-type N-terminal cleavage/methylation domain-containing protein [Gammaproteobacteria bacterium]|nr:prepilin-type N-terminal cleavage/methylation domain-containing protein [Gammaproteobacteria bacterium]